ncbi:MAG: hypothetical protein GC179_14215 [Anaerolineaceae bacterium]|nr:hypothetical protein [Anaerolineaceae bacterium]
MAFIPDEQKDGYYSFKPVDVKPLWLVAFGDLQFVLLQKANIVLFMAKFAFFPLKRQAGNTGETAELTFCVGGWLADNR